MEKTQENKNILPVFLRNNEVVQLQEVGIAHIYIFMTNSLKMSVFTKKKTHVDQESLSLGNVWFYEETWALLGYEKQRNAPWWTCWTLALTPG